MIKKLLKLLLSNLLGKKSYRKYSSSDYKRRGGHRHYGHNHYRKKHSSHSFFSS